MTGARLDQQAATMLLDNLLAEAQPYAGTLCLGGEERYENTIHDLGEYAMAIVAHGDFNIAVGHSACIEFDDAIAGFGCILDKVDEHLHQQPWVSIDLKSGGGDIATKPVAIELLLVVEILLNRHGLHLWLRDACEFAVILDKLQQSLATAVYHGQSRVCTLVHPLCGFRQADDGGK